MSWTDALDRAVLREIDHTGSSDTNKEQVAELVQSLLRLNAGRNESYFSLGYAEGLHGTALDAYAIEELDTDHARWHNFGKVMSGLRRRKRDDEEEEPDLTGLIEDPEISSHLMPILLKKALRSGNLDEAVRTLEKVLAAGSPTEEATDLLRSTLAEILRRAERPRERLEASNVIELLERCTSLPGFDELPPEIRAPFHRSIVP